MKPPRDTSFRLSGRLRSFRYALRGMKAMVVTQHNAWIHLAVTVGVVAMGLVLRIGRWDWCWIIVAMTMVWVAEALNTAVEFLCDAVSPEFNPTIGHAKDVAAAGVLISAAGAAAVGVIVFWPYLFR